jgi:hypothetical protein
MVRGSRVRALHLRSGTQGGCSSGGDMRRVIVVRSYPRGPRCWIIDQRVHHGAAGLALLLAGVTGRRRYVMLAGLLLCAHDRRDVTVWLRREHCPRTDIALDTAGAIP